ncbi:MAG: hypothetical protein OEY85_11375, partial [Rhodospirillales bacterium]|nr:hypothetical protein [Rhodospirillales bacterium]
VVAAGGEFTLTDGTLVGDTATGSVTFNRAANTIVATNASAFSGASAGEVITVSGTTENNGTYTIQSVSADGKTVTIDSNYLTDEGLSSGNAFFDYTTDSQVVFNTAGTITVQDTGGGNLAGAFGGLKVGDTITVAGAPTAGNNTTYTISAISNSPNSQITVTPVPVANETDTNGTVFTATGYSYTASTRLEYTSTNTVQVQDNAGTPVANVFANLRVGQTITLSGSPPNNGAQIITAINNTTSEITVSGTPFTVGTDTDGANIKVYAEDGTITASSSYYYGDDVDRNHRVDLQRNFDFDVNAIDPAFEKAIRAMGIIAQGVFGTEGGLDQNSSRADDALYLLKSALDLTDGTPPYGAELDSNMAELELALVFDQLTLSRATEKHIQLLSFSKGTIGDIENIDSAEVISKLLADSNALEASYKAISRVRGLSLADYL